MNRIKYIHIGKNKPIYTNDIIGIFDMDKTTISYQTREYLKICQQSGIIKDFSSRIPYSFIVVNNNGHNETYLSSISALTLKNREYTGKNNNHNE